MRRIIILVFLLVFIAWLPIAPARTATSYVPGSRSPGVTTDELNLVLKGWSAKKGILGKDVYNDLNEKIGKVDDLIIAQDLVNYAIIGTGAFVGLAKHNVAISFKNLKFEDKKIILPGATKDEILMPEFEYPGG